MLPITDVKWAKPIFTTLTLSFLQQEAHTTSRALNNYQKGL